MTALVWDEAGKHYGETGADHGVIYRLGNSGIYDKAEVWNGLTAVNTEPEGGDAQDNYADNIKYLTIRAAENFKGTIEAFYFPESFAECDGTALIDSTVKGLYATQQTRVPFGLSWRTLLYNDTQGEIGYKIHFAYGCTAAPSTQNNQTVNDSPELKKFSWSFTGSPVPVPGMKPSAYFYVSSLETVPAKMKALTDALHGTQTAEPKLPTPAEIVALMKAAN